MHHLQLSGFFIACCKIKVKSLAAPYLRRLVAGFPPLRPGFKPGSGHKGFCDGQKWRWCRFSPRNSVFRANVHSICFSTIIFTITLGWHNRPGVAAVPIVSETTKKKVKSLCLIITPGDVLYENWR
jgi:hypothetical protein